MLQNCRQDKTLLILISCLILHHIHSSSVKLDEAGTSSLFFMLSCSVFSYKLRYIVGFWLVEKDISTNQKPTIYRNLYENTGPEAKTN